MKTDLKILGFALWVTLVPMAALAQTASGTDGSVTSPDGSVPDASANPFAGANGAGTFYQDNSLAGAAQSNSGDAPGNNDSMSSSAPAGPPPAPEDSSTGLSANPFVGAAGADKYYQHNSLTGASQSPDAGALGGSLGNASAWATTP
jgi:hypothetical protein